MNDSLARLNLNDIDIILCHDIEFASLDQIGHETLLALQILKDTGKVRSVPVLLPPQLQRHIAAKAPALLADRGVGIISASPLSMGVPSGQAYPDWHSASPEVKAACARAAELCKAHGKSLAKLAVQFAVRNRSVATTLVGMNSVDVVRENVKTALEVELQNCGNIDEALRQQVEEILQQVKNLTRPSGREENNWL